MSKVQRVAVAGAGRVGLKVVQELVQTGFETSVLTRNTHRSSAFPPDVTVFEVDYDSGDSLQNALRDHDALVSTVAMSAITNQKRMIDAAIEAGVQHFIPAEYTLATRDSKAQWLPTYATVLDIQKYLSTREDQINWMVIGCGALLEFSFDYPFILDFDSRTATFWDGGEGATSLSNVRTIAQAVVGVLKQPHRVQNHGVRVHGGVLSQREALRIAKKYSVDTWTVQERESEPAIRVLMDWISGAATLRPDEVAATLIELIAAATFGKGHFEGAYSQTDNDWLGVEEFGGNEVEEAIRQRITEGTQASRSVSDADESMSDVAGSIAAKFSENTL